MLSLVPCNISTGLSDSLYGNNNSKEEAKSKLKKHLNKNISSQSNDIDSDIKCINKEMSIMSEELLNVE